MFKTIWEALKEQTRLIGQNPSAAYGAAMSALNVVFLIICIKLGLWLLEAKDKIITITTKQSEQITTIQLENGRYARNAQEAEQIWRDSAFYWRTRYQERIIDTTR